MAVGVSAERYRNILNVCYTIFHWLKANLVKELVWLPWERVAIESSQLNVLQNPIDYMHLFHIKLGPINRNRLIDALCWHIKFFGVMTIQIYLQQRYGISEKHS